MIVSETFLVLTAILFGLAALAFWGAMAVHCLKSSELKREERVLWLLVLVFGKLLAAGVYYLVRYRRQLPAAC